MKGLAEMPYKSLQITQSKSVVRVTFNRPKVLNALNEEMIAETTDIFQSLSKDISVRVVVLEGNGKAFSAGADLAYMKMAGESDLAQNEQQGNNLAKMYQAIDCLLYTSPSPRD